MFQLFTQFLAFIIQNLEEYIIENSPVNDEILRHIFGIYTLINRINLTLDKFIDVIEVWQRDFYHGAAWSGSHFCISTLHNLMVLINNDLRHLIDLICSQNSPTSPELRNLLNYQFLGDPYCSKVDVFDIWMRIIKRNANDRFCGWISHYSDTEGKTLDVYGKTNYFLPLVERRTLFIPNYSLLLLEVKATSSLENLSQSQWAKNINIYGQTLPEWQGYALKFLPEFPPKFPIEMEGYTSLKDNHYALMIEVPRQEEIVTNIITSIKKDIAAFYQPCRRFKNTLQIAIQDRIEIIF